MRNPFSNQSKIFLVLFVLFAVVNALWLHRMPGLLGDEASEGENVYEKIVAARWLATGEGDYPPEGYDTWLLGYEGLLIGERSYIGPLMDYVRAPFIGLFGYSTIALRIPVYLLSLASFLLAASVFRRLFGEQVALIVLVVTFFSPVYLSFQRLGWSITLFPFFVVLLLWLMLGTHRYRALLGGVVAGFGLHNHILFLPSLVAVAAGWLTYEISRGKEWFKRLVALWPAVIGFVGAFATQFFILKVMMDDQGDPSKVAELIGERWNDLPLILPLVLSGSSYVARYTGVEFSGVVVNVVTYSSLAFVVAALALSKKRKLVAVWLLALLVHLAVLLYMVDRFTLRYFLVFTLGVWVMAGVGLGEVIERVVRKNEQAMNWAALVIAGILIAVWTWFVAVPFLQTGGSVRDFSLGNRTNSAAALVDVRPLIACLRPLGTVSSENVHIYNRIQYLSHRYDDLEVIHESEAKTADYLIHYRREDSPDVPVEREQCPELFHFIVERNETIN